MPGIPRRTPCQATIRWLMFPVEQYGLVVAAHVIPMGDYRPHDPTPDCWCHPKADEMGLHTHRPMDQRETYGRGRRRVH